MKPSKSSTPAEPYGLVFYRTLRKLGVTSLFDYAKIQQLKRADRAETAKLLRNFGYAVIQLVKEHDPEDAAHYVHHRWISQRVAGGQQWAMIVPFLM